MIKNKLLILAVSLFMTAHVKDMNAYTVTWQGNDPEVAEILVYNTLVGCSSFRLAADMKSPWAERLLTGYHDESQETGGCMGSCFSWARITYKNGRKLYSCWAGDGCANISIYKNEGQWEASIRNGYYIKTFSEGKCSYAE